MQTFRILMGEKVSGVMCDETARMKGKKRKGSENKAGLETVALRKRRQAELEGAESKNVERHGQTLIDPGVTDGESRLRWFGGEEDAGQDEMEADD